MESIDQNNPDNEHRFSLIIVEDELMTRNALSELIPWDKWGFRVDALFSDGTECIEYIEKNTPDVILTDIKMPRTSGLDIAEYVFEQGLSAQIVLMSAYREFSFAQKALEYGVTYYILKPISVPELCDKMEKIRQKLMKENKASGEESHGVQESSEAESSLPSYRQAVKYIEEHYNEEITLNDLSEKLFLSPAYLSHLLKSQTGKTYSELVAEKRVEKAIWYLENTGLMVYEIADRVGYHTLKYFYVVFKKVTGKTPNDFRKNEKK